MLVYVLRPQWESPVSSCLAWASAAHKHTGGPLLHNMGVYGDTWHGGMSHAFNPTRKPPQRGCENWKEWVLWNDDPHSKLIQNQTSLSSAFQSTIGTSSQTLYCVVMQWAYDPKEKGLVRFEIFLWCNCIKRKKAGFRMFCKWTC